MSRFGTIKISGVEYDLDDLTLDEMESLEEMCGVVAFSELNYGSAKVMKAISFTLMRRGNPELTLEDVGAVKLVDFAPPDEEMPRLPPAAGDETNPKDGSEPEDSGLPLSVASTPG